jgi:dienelactone hydrolase
MHAARSTHASRRFFARPKIWLGTLVLLVVIVVPVKLALSFDAPDEFFRQKGELAGARLEAADGDSLHAAYHVVLTSDAGYRVRGYMRVPRAPGPWPAIVVIGGTHTGRMAAELFTPDEPYVILGLDYPWEGPRELNWFQFLVRIFDVRRAMLLTPSAVMLATDYLESRPDVDISGLVLAGASFGAQLITIAGALDDRAGSVLIIYGGGDYAALLRANLKVKPVWLRSVIASAGAGLLAPIEPLDYAGLIAPRRTVILNGREDDRIPHESVERLYEAAGEPKELVWLDAGHINSRDPSSIERVLRAASRALSSDSVASHDKENSER